MPAIPPDLLNRLRDTLARCNSLTSDRAVRDLFVDARLAPWRNRVPENTPDRETRVNALIDCHARLAIPPRPTQPTADQPRGLGVLNFL